MSLIKSCVLFGLTFLIYDSTLAQQANVNLDFNPQKNTQNLFPYGGNVISPEVRDDHTVTFRLKAPDAHKVELTGGPILLALKSKDPLPFVKGADGMWSLTVGPLKPDIYVYRFLLDGVAGLDQGNDADGGKYQCRRSQADQCGGYAGRSREGN